VSGVEFDLGKYVGVLRLPSPWQRLDDMPDQPYGTQVAGFITETCQAIVFVRRVLQTAWMPLDTGSITDSIAKVLSEDVGLLDVGVHKTASGIPYAYTLVKAKMEPSGLNFNVTLHLHSDYRHEIDAFFTEIGTTGVREALVWELAMREGRVRPGPGGLEGWTVDPHGIGGAFLPNLADDVEYDEKFREHALAEARAFLRAVRGVESLTPAPEPEPALSPAWEQWVEDMYNTVYAADQGIVGTLIASDSRGLERGFLVSKPRKDDVNFALEPYEDGPTFLRSYGEQGQSRLEALGFKFGRPAPDGWRGIGINVSWVHTRQAVEAAARVMAELWEISDPTGCVTLNRKGEFECPTCGGPLTVYPSKGRADGRQDRYLCSPGGFTHVPVGWSPGTDGAAIRQRIDEIHAELDRIHKDLRSATREQRAALRNYEDALLYDLDIAKGAADQ